MANKGRALCYAEDNRDADNHKIKDGRDVLNPKNNHRLNTLNLKNNITSKTC